MIGFVDFCRDVLGVRLTPGQRVLASVAFDGAEPRDLDPDIARRIFGEVDRIPAEARHVLAAVCGARGGKSYVLGGLYSLWRALTADLSSTAPGQEAVALVVAPDMRLAREDIRYVTGAAESASTIKRCISRKWADGIELTRPDDGRKVRIECLPATRGGSAVRGRTLVSAVLDEACFFRSADTGVVNDDEVFKAVAARVIPGGAVVVCSTPWSESGLLFSLWKANRTRPTSAIAAHAPTTLLRDDAHTLKMVERERQRDPQNAAREFDAQFIDAGSGLFFSPAAIDKATRDDVPGRLAPVGYRPPRAAAAADFGFRSDHSALVVVRYENRIVRVAEVLELAPKKGAPLKPSEVVRQFAAVARAHGCGSITTDGHYIEAIREHARSNRIGIRLAPSGQSGKLDTHVRARSLLYGERCEFSAAPEQRRLIQQLKQIQATPQAGGGLRITHPRRAGQGHGDVASAWVLAVNEIARPAPRRRGNVHLYVP